ncbi:hypothetical protein MAR_016838, partial [Mya arenaria]
IDVYFADLLCICLDRGVLQFRSKDSNAISSEALKPALTFASESTRIAERHKSGESIPANETTASEQYKAEGALEALECALATPVRRKYKDRVVEGYDVQESSPCFEVYKKLYSKAHPRTSDVSEQTENSALKGLDLLASTVLSLGIGHHNKETNREDTTQAVGIDLENVVSGTSNSDSYLSPALDVSKSSTDISPAVSEALVYPKLHAGNKTKRRRILEDLPDNLTSEDTIRKMSLRELEKIKTFAEREKKSKSCYYKKMKTKQSKVKVTANMNTQKTQGKKSETCTNDKRGIAKDLEFCKGCLMTWQEELEIDRESIWIQCDICDGWLHSDCIADSVAEDEPFQCPDCTLKTGH